MKYILFGASGKMGKRIQALASNEHELVRAFSSKDDLENLAADVVIDFSHADNFDRVLAYCIENSLPLVSGTTNLSATQFQNIKEAANSIPLLWASNTSLGVEVVRSILQNLSGLDGWDAHIHEAHHIHKVDSPSGTAKTLQEDVEKALDRKVNVTATRGGGIIGEHEVRLVSENESISISHMALNRDLFADGAIKAALFVSQQKAGQYFMRDVLQA